MSEAVTKPDTQSLTVFAKPRVGALPVDWASRRISWLTAVPARGPFTLAVSIPHCGLCHERAVATCGSARGAHPTTSSPTSPVKGARPRARSLMRTDPTVSPAPGAAVNRGGQ